MKGEAVPDSKHGFSHWQRHNARFIYQARQANPQATSLQCFDSSVTPSASRPFMGDRHTQKFIKFCSTQALITAWWSSLPSCGKLRAILARQRANCSRIEVATRAILARMLRIGVEYLDYRRSVSFKSIQPPQFLIDLESALVLDPSAKRVHTFLLHWAWV